MSSKLIYFVQVAESLGLISAVVFLSLAVLTLVWSVSNIEDLAILCGE